jgi:hypothetical protein
LRGNYRRHFVTIRAQGFHTEFWTLNPLLTLCRAAIIDNMVSQFGRKGFIFEQYDDKSGEGLKHKPFAGWSALVLLIMAEMY